MSDERHETIADIVAAMRNEGHAGDASCLEWVSAKFTSYANRIEAAAKREREAGAEAAQICGEIGEAVGREETREKSSQVGNAAKMREALRGLLEIVCIDCNSSYEVDGKCVKCPRVVAAEAALSAPPRNCDRPECATSNAAQDVWRKEDGGKTAYYEWLLAKYTK